MSDAVKLTIVSDAAESELNPAPTTLTVGERLAAARAQQDLSVEQVASQLKWSVRQITEIEAGNYAVFPDMLTLRGFVRTYAKILKIDSTSLVEDLTVEYERLPAKPLDRPKLDTPFPTGRMPLLGKHHNNSQKILGGVVLVSLCLLTVFVWRDQVFRAVHGIYPAASEVAADQQSKSVNQPLLPEKASDAAVNANSPALPSTSAAQQSGLPVKNTEEKVQIPAPPADGVVHETVPSKPAEPAAGVGKAVSTQQAETQNSQPVAVSAADALVLNFKQDSWVQIKRVDGTIVVSKLYRAGSQDVINVGGPLNMVIGNAPGVEATLRGQSLSLPLQPGSNVVNLSIK